MLPSMVLVLLSAFCCRSNIPCCFLAVVFEPEEERLSDRFFRSFLPAGSSQDTADVLSTLWESGTPAANLA